MGTLAGIISWRSNKTAPIPLKIVYTVGGVFVSSIMTHQKFRDNLKERIASKLPDNLKEHCLIIDEKIGMFGADFWNQSEELFNDLKSRLFKQ